MYFNINQEKAVYLLHYQSLHVSQLTMSLQHSLQGLSVVQVRKSILIVKLISTLYDIELSIIV